MAEPQRDDLLPQAVAQEEPSAADAEKTVRKEAAARRVKLAADFRRYDVRRYAKTARRVGRYLVPATAALYAVGFVISVFYYHRRGVPLHALGHPEFIGAGLLFAVFTALSYVWGSHLGTRRRWWTGLLEYLFSAGALFGIFSNMFGMFGGGDHRAAAANVLAFMSFAALRHWIGTARGINMVIRDKPRPPPDPEHAEGPQMDLAGEIQIWVLLVIGFGWLVFPVVPQWLGGGAPQQVEVLWSAPATVDEQPLLGNPAEPRCAFEVFSDAQYVYLETFRTPKDGRCSLSSTNGWRSFLPHIDDVGDGARTFVAVPRARIRMLSYR